MFSVSYRWKALPVPKVGDPKCKDIPYQRYGHTAVAFGDLAYIWGGRNDKDGACSVLYQYETGNSLFC